VGESRIIEKYVDLAYRRDAEAATPWDVRTLAAAPQTNGGVFYPLSRFAPAGQTPLQLPDYVHASNNYFSLAWTSHRRIKNAIMVDTERERKSKTTKERG